MEKKSVFVKLTNKDCIHNGYEYREGINIIDEPFNNEKICDKGGLYFCRQKDFAKWIEYNDNHMYWIWDVVILDDAKIVDMDDKLKTDKFILSNKRCIWLDYELCKLAVQQDGFALSFVKIEQNEELCKLAVQQNGLSLEYVKEQSIMLCKLAVKQDSESIQFVSKNLTYLFR